MSRLIEGLDYFDRITKGRVKSKTLIYGGEEDQDRTKFRVRSWKSADTYNPAPDCFGSSSNLGMFYPD